MSRPTAIIAYGRPEDRLKLAAVAHHTGTSGSKLVIENIRSEYTRLFGDLDPHLAAPKEVE